MKRIGRVVLSAGVAGLSPLAVHAAPVFSDNFNTAASATNYNVYSTTDANNAATGTATFGFNYSTLGIPSAPNSGDGTTVGVRVQSDDIGTTAAAQTLGAVSVATKNVVLPAKYKIAIDVWSNYIGGTTINDAAGSNGTTGATLAGGVAGTTYDSALTNSGTQEGGVLVDAIRDPTGAGGTYRLYTGGTNHGNTDSKYSIYAASGGSDTATTAQMYTNAYYASLFPAKSAPTAQSTASSTQTGQTPAGTFGFAWHTVTLTNDGTNTVWAIDGTPIATVADSSYTAGGTALSFGDQDSNTGGSSGAGQTYNFNVYDNLVVTDLAATPEPASLGLLGAAGVGLLVRRRMA